MTPKGFVDLHSHYVPAIDDGVKTYEDGVALCQALAAIGYSDVVATPHIRTAMYENRRQGIQEAHAAFVARSASEPGMPALGVASEHFFDDVFWDLFERGEILPYPGGRAALVELPAQTMPRHLDKAFFRMAVKGVRVVLAHPERYAQLFRKTDALDPLLDVGVLPQLDLMSLTGKYGSEPKRAAERMLEEGIYFLASSDAHKPADVPVVADAIARLKRAVGDQEALVLLSEHPRSILDGTLPA